MKEDYLVPEYYPKFACKMGACRHPCCVGWPISVSTDDYFRLLGVDCAPALRAKLDTAVRVSLHPTPEAYAQIAPTWEGDCPPAKQARNPSPPRGVTLNSVAGIRSKSV